MLLGEPQPHARHAAGQRFRHTISLGRLLLFAPQRAAAEASRATFGKALAAKGFDPITTEILDAPEFYYAEAYHQQYLDKNPGGYCGLGGTGVTCQIGTGVAAE